MNRPFVAVVAAYGIGLLLAQFAHPSLRALLIVFVLVAVVVLVFKTSRRLSIWPLLALAGWTNFTARTAVLSPEDLRVVVGANEPAIVTVRGTLAETPHLKIAEHQGREIWRSVARVRVREIGGPADYRPAAGEVLVTTPGVLGPDFFSGQPVEISGTISRPPVPLAEGLFDFRDYLAARGIYYQVRADSTNDWSLLDPHSSKPPLTDRFLNWSKRTLAQGLPQEDEPLRLLWAMTLGWHTAFTGDIADPYLEAGTMHMFAIDGLRIALLSGMIVTLLRVLRLSRAWCGLIAIPAIWFYTAATGWEASAIRASVMMSIVLGGWALKRPGDLVNSLAAAAFIILLLDPRQLLEASFQLSFFVMLVIAVMLPPLNAFSDRVLALMIGPDPLLAEDLVPAWRRKLLPWTQHFARFCGLSFAAWMGSLPLAAKYFHLFSPVSTPANVAAVPLGALALTANLGAILCGQWLPWFTDLFNHAAWFFMVAMTWVSVKFAALPGAYFYVPEPSWSTVILYYALVVALFSGWFKPRGQAPMIPVNLEPDMAKTRKPFLPLLGEKAGVRAGFAQTLGLMGSSGGRKILGAAALILVAMACLIQWQLSRGETDITVLPLDGGHAIYVDADGRRDDWLVNCGGKDAVNFTLKDYLQAQGVNVLPRLALADGNARNCGGAPQLGQLFGIGELWTSGIVFRSPAYRAALAAFDGGSQASAGPHHDPPPGGQPQGSRHKIFRCGETNGCWRTLFPPPDAVTATASEAPLVLLGNFHGTRILLLSELNRDGQSALLAQTNDLRADIVIAGLPDQGEPLCNDLIAAIQPRVIVIADSDFPAARRAGRALQRRLEQTRIPVLYTRASGAVKIVTKKGGWKLQTMDGQNLERFQ